MAADGFFLANLEMSTDASVCPALTKTPPSLEIIGNICPGEIISFLGEVDQVKRHF